MRACVEGAPVRLTPEAMAVPVAGWSSSGEHWTVEALAVVIATPAGTRVLAVGDLDAYPPPDDGPGAALAEAERDRLVDFVFVPVPGMPAWRLLRASGCGAVLTGAADLAELARLTYGDGAPRLVPR